MTRTDSRLTARFHDCSYGTGMDRLNYGLHRAPQLKVNWIMMAVYDQLYDSVSVSVYYVAVRTIVLSRHGSNLARPVIIHDIIHGLLYVASTPCCGFFGVSPDGNCAYVH